MKIKGKKRVRRVVGSIVFAVAILILFQSTFFPKFSAINYISEKGSYLASVVSGVLTRNTNDYRVSNNESPLVVSKLLTEAAQMKADDMAERSYFSHVGPDGERPWYWFKKVNYKYEYAGENLAVDFTESDDISQAWIDSAKHKANLLNSNFTEIGIGIADGFYEGRKTIFVVQFFGKPYAEKTEVTTKAVRAPVVVTTKLSTTSDPTVAVATRNDIPSGEVLGLEDLPSKIANNNTWLWLVGSLIFLALISFGVYKKTRG
ncbi:MAG: hypothetical protein A2566_00515 [Candidatus Zambryskibacteria bacterium RIFOXYD1_FULL_40_13]|nr:MAG: SCP-like protein extracellular [Parcubacteria group bacterium GW2011_GWC1_39_12]KKR19612.1 MAG: SCP-like protein extracellular [Parcubacteria group bacterium GW2011_GWF1_39_37]KKR35766.1 MAG: SCP-like protein extracellular [Parcubacteria group bacterium GW2011_GWC2_40_10]KKR52580.1 MAG: SCP-like protein extracellular [Parcubacteria group bacterium GW2011_GWE1_40_20]KKR65519.1 MAG: SCP-like protein extracellular [Parcubacteria group bacterium GW2011_GWB1_40_5]KKR68690.1 MAG: SCP-like pr